MEILLQQIEYIMIMVSPFNHKLRIHQFFHNYTCKFLLVIIIFYKKFMVYLSFCRPEDLRIPFERYGPVKDVYLPKNYYTGYALFFIVILWIMLEM